MQTSEYQEQAQKFISDAGIEFRAVHIGNDCPPFCEDHAQGKAMDELDKWPRKSHVHGHHYHVTFSRKGRGHLTIDFWNSYADEFHNKCVSKALFNWQYGNYKLQDMVKAERAKGMQRFEPTPYDVLACIQKYELGSFEEFCGDCGYDTDSRKAEQVYFAVQREWAKVRVFFTREEIEQLQEIS